MRTRSRYAHITNPQWEQIRAQQQAFSGIFAWSPDRLNLARGGEIRLTSVLWVSGDFFSVLLAVIGLYGVISYMVARRTNEIGIRMALGADGGGIVRMILREALLLLGIGLVMGVGLSLAAARTASSMLFGVKPYDPATLGFAVSALAVVAIGASYIPARRAAGVDPLVALREE